MSAIPPDIVGSAIQAGYAQRESARLLETDRSGQSDGARSRTRALHEASSSIETGDNDTQVFTDAEGSGSQGRSAPEEEEASQENSGPPSAASDSTGQTFLDIQA